MRSWCRILTVSSLALCSVLSAVELSAHDQGHSYFGPTSLKGLSTEEGITVQGPFVGSSVEIAWLTVYGPATMTTGTVHGDLIVKGPLNLQDSFVNGDIHVKGPVSIVHTAIDGNTDIAGPLTATNSVFKGNVMSASKTTKFSKTTVLGDVKILDYEKNQTLELINGSVIKGTVTFESGQGTITMDSDSKIDGRINGALVKSPITNPKS